MLLNGKVAIVTGAAQGIGRACAERCAAEGAKVVIADTNDVEGAKASAAICEAGRSAIFVQTNISEKLDVHNVIASTLEAYGHVDIMVANAGIVDDVPFLELEDSEFDRILRINLKGTFLCAQAAARQIVKQIDAGRAPGAIVTMSSVNAFFGLPDHAAYATSKGGIAQLTRSMAIALAPHGIRVNAVGPGTIETPLIKDVVKDDAFRDTVLSRTPLGRIGRPEEIAAIVAWLASDQASYITGETIYADGGRLPLNYIMPSRD
ncbi:MAG: SDR family NAD(P)-dependent oxidoreductase [Hyphomicrobiaceae bacterium]